MAFGKFRDALDRQMRRLQEGKAHKIRPADLDKLIAKLDRRRESLQAEAEAKPHKAERIAEKLIALEEILQRAQALRAGLEEK